MAPFSIEVVRAGKPLVKVDVPTQNRARADLTPWPSMLLEKGDVVTLATATHRCSNTLVDVDPNHNGGTWQARLSSEKGCEDFTDGAVVWEAGKSVYMPEKF